MNLTSVVPSSRTGRRRRRLMASVCVAAVVALAAVVSIASLAVAATSFPDVPAGHPYYAAITDLADRGVIAGYTNGDFGPGDQVKRQQFAKMIVLACGYPVSEADVCHFVDVEKSGAGDLFPDNYIAVCAAHGITVGKTATRFDPYSSITRYQVLSMVVRAAGDLQPGLLSTPPPGWTGAAGWHSDVTHGANAARAEYNGLLTGMDLSVLDPRGNMTRGEVAQVLHNLLDLLAPVTTTTTAGSTTTTTSTSTTTTSSTTTSSTTTTTLAATVNLTTSVSPAAGGTVTRNPNQSAFNVGSSAQLTAVAAGGYTFTGWSGDATGNTNPLTVVMNADKTIVAVFSADVSLATTVSPPGGGTIAKTPNQSTFTPGSTVQLKANPAAGFTFTGWDGDASGNTNPLTVVMSTNKAITAKFTSSSGYYEVGSAPVGSSPPAVCSMAAGRLDLFVIDGGGHLNHKWSTGGGWSSGWEDLGGSLDWKASPAAVSWGPGRMDVFARGTDGHLKHIYYSGGWSAWSDHGGSLTSGPAVASYAADRLDIFARWSNGHLWHLYWDHGWSTWSDQGGTLHSGSSPAAVSYGFGRIDIFVRWTDDHLYHKYWDAGWSAWSDHDGILSAGPAVASWASNHLDIFARGASGGLWQLTWGPPWGTWTSRGGNDFVGAPAAISMASGRIDVFVLSPTNKIWWKQYYGGVWYPNP